jgi:hypothetical protein
VLRKFIVVAAFLFILVLIVTFVEYLQPLYWSGLWGEYIGYPPACLIMFERDAPHRHKISDIGKLPCSWLGD